MAPLQIQFLRTRRNQTMGKRESIVSIDSSSSSSSSFEEGSPKSIESSPSSEDGTPIRPVFCLKKKMDMRKFEEVDDCFILEFDPYEDLEVSNLSLSDSSALSDDTDLSVVAEKGQVACRDYPHPRHLCVKFPFEETPHETHCDMCFCFVCDTAAPCEEWTVKLKHCNASENGGFWMLLKNQKRRLNPNLK